MSFWKRPNVEVFKSVYSGKEQVPWNNEKYLKTSVEDDGALQFGKNLFCFFFKLNVYEWINLFIHLFKDIEEDLDVLDIQSQEKLTDKNNNENNNLVISSYEKKLKESEAKIEELVDVVSKLRYETIIDYSKYNVIVNKKILFKYITEN